MPVNLTDVLEGEDSVTVKALASEEIDSRIGTEPTDIMRGDTVTSFKNKIINGLLNINQREVTGTVVLTVGEYGHDRYKAGAGGCTYTFSTVANVTIITITAGSLIQVVEGLNLQSGIHILSWSGTSQCRIDAGSYGASGLTTSLVGGTDATIEVGIGTFTKHQLEEGSVATPFEQRPVGYELSLCQRYYFNEADCSLSASSGSGGRTIGFYKFPITMRVTPTIGSINYIALNYYNSDGDTSATTRGAVTPSINGVSFGSDRLTALGNVVNYFTGLTFKADAEL